jgi:ribosome-associated toxin RatA of RatAB toxin-antitoxin module
MFKSFLSPVTKRHVERKVLQTHPLHLFRIIQDVDQYQTFLPMCSYSKIIRRSPDGRSFDGKLIIGSPPYFSEEYISRVLVIPEQLTIETESIESHKFDSLRSRWKLGLAEVVQEAGGGGGDTEEKTFCCDVSFEVEMTVSDPLIVAVLDKVLREIAGRQVEAFDKRCQELPMPFGLIEAAAKLRKQ